MPLPSPRRAELARDAPDRVQFSGPDFSFSLVRDERPLTEHVHLAFPADTDASCVHAAALSAGYEDHGTPGERAAYHTSKRCVASSVGREP